MLLASGARRTSCVSQTFESFLNAHNGKWTLLKIYFLFFLIQKTMGKLCMSRIKYLLNVKEFMCDKDFMEWGLTCTRCINHIIARIFFKILIFHTGNTDMIYTRLIDQFSLSLQRNLFIRLTMELISCNLLLKANCCQNAKKYIRKIEKKRIWHLYLVHAIGILLGIEKKNLQIYIFYLNIKRK